MISGVFSSFLARFSGSRKDRRFLHRVSRIGQKEEHFRGLSDSALQEQTCLFRKRLSGGETPEDLLEDSFAVVREAARRILKQRPFDVQLAGALALHAGMIAEMKTGEGKTLAATLPTYLHALSGLGVHIVTVNDYLARRDSAWMGEVYRFLGLSVGCITSGQDEEERRSAYACDVTYGTNNEFGFDYLRDNMKFSTQELVQRGFHYAIIDEVDSILIDEARTPLIISGPSEGSYDLYHRTGKYMHKVAPEHYVVEEKARTSTFTEAGVDYLETALRRDGLLRENEGLYDVAHTSLVHHCTQSLRAAVLFKRDRDYIVQEGKLVIVDEFTGRMMEGRRYGEGLHQALEAKEGLKVQPENQTLASITFQNYFRLYPRLAGMTGTAMTESAEFAEIYGLEVAAIPTHQPVRRDDQDDVVYRTTKEKNAALVALIEECHLREQPILIGTVSIEKSESLSALLKRHKLPHRVLNARYHAQEAAIIAQAGVAGAITIATNMAGRGTDIQLGGNPDARAAAWRKKEEEQEADTKKREAHTRDIERELAQERARVIRSGGLFVIGSERHESRRIDNQLRGRCGRQGDPGCSRFFLSLEDDLLRIFAADRIDSMLGKLGLETGEAIAHPWVNKALEKAQAKVEARNFEIRKNLLRFDDVVNAQRKITYEQRRTLIDPEKDYSGILQDMREEILSDSVRRCIPKKALPEQWDGAALEKEMHRIFALQVPVDAWTREEGIAEEEILQRLHDMLSKHRESKIATFSLPVWRRLEKHILLVVLDKQWKDHLLSLDHLRGGIGLRAYGQRDPLNEYKQEAFVLFEEMLQRVREESVLLLARIELRPNETPRFPVPSQTQHASPQRHTTGTLSKPPSSAPAVPARRRKIARNVACPCGSGLKYKRCCGKFAV